MRINSPLLKQVSASSLFKEFKSGCSTKELSEKYKVTPEAILQTLRKNRKAYYAARKLASIKRQKERWIQFHALIKLMNRLPTLEESAFLLELERKQHYDDLIRQARHKGYKNDAIVEYKRAKRKEEMLNYLKQLAGKLGHTPGALDIDKSIKYWGSTYNYFFGSLRNAQKLAGLKPVPPGNSKERLQRRKKI